MAQMGGISVGVDLTVLSYNSEGIGNYLGRTFQALFDDKSQPTRSQPVTSTASHIKWVLCGEEGPIRRAIGSEQIDKALSSGKITICETTPSTGIAGGLRTALKIRNLQKSHNWDYVLSTHSHLVTLFSQNPIWLVHDLGPLLHPEYFLPKQQKMAGAKSPLFAWLFRSALSKADLILTSTRTMGGEISNFAGRTTAQVIPLGGGLGVPQKSNPDKSQTQFLNHNNLTPGNYFCSINTISPRKNIEVIIEQFSAFLLQEKAHTKPGHGVSQEFDQKLPKLVIAGKDGWETDKVYAKFRELAGKYPELGLEDKIIFSGFVTDEEHHDILVNTKGLIYASSYEGFGISALEAIAAGIEIIISDIPVFQELYAGYAHFFSLEKPEELAAKFTQVYRGDKIITAEKISDILAEYNWNNVSRNLEHAIISFAKNR